MIMLGSKICWQSFDGTNERLQSIIQAWLRLFALDRRTFSDNMNLHFRSFRECTWLVDDNLAVFDMTSVNQVAILANRFPRLLAA